MVVMKAMTGSLGSAREDAPRRAAAPRPPAALLALALALAAGCGSQEAPAPGGAAAAPAAPAATEKVQPRPVDPAATGTLVGTVTVTGAVAPRAPLPTSAEAWCAGHSGGSVPDESLRVTDGRLAGAVVWLADELPQWIFPERSDAVVLDQVGCRYVPHVLALQLGQTLEVRNGDEVMHNVNCKARRNSRSNVAMTAGSAPRTFEFRRAEVAVPFVCDVHPWMSAHVAVVPHPLFAVTGEDGAFRIAGIPEGRHAFEIWHERLGTKRIEVEVRAGAEVAAGEISWPAP